MIFVTFAQLRGATDFSKFDVDLITEGFRIASDRNYVWTTIDKLEEDSLKFAQEKGWDPETTLVLYDPPKTPEEIAAMEERVKKLIEQDPDWDDIQIGPRDPGLHITLFQNMTLERLVKVILKPSELKAFL